MLRRTIGIVFAATLLPLTARAQAPAPPAAKETPKEAKETPRDLRARTRAVHECDLDRAQQTLVCCTERNWPLAAYELGEIKEVMGDVQDLVPTFKNLPLADMLDAVITKEIVALEKAIDAKDFKAFTAGYDKLTAACNACHQGTENGFIVIKRPTQPAFTNQDYRPRN